MADLWLIFPLICIAMMVYFMLFSKDSEHGHGGCMGMMNSSREQELEKEIVSLKEEITEMRK
jgi:uncharacterized membrane protein